MWYAAAALRRAGRAQHPVWCWTTPWMRATPRATPYSRHITTGVAMLDEAQRDRSRRPQGERAMPLSFGAIDAAVEEISMALQQGDMEQMKARSASLFLENYSTRAKAFGDVSSLLNNEPEFIGSLLQTCVDTRRLATARTLFASLEATPGAPRPDGAAYAAMILGYCAQRVPERALSLLRAASAAGVQLEDETWLHSQVVYALGQSNKLSQLDALLPDLTAAYGSRNPPEPLPRVIYRRLVQAFIRCGEFEQALGYADELQLMYQHEPSDPRQNETLVGYIIDGCFRARNPINATRLLEWLCEESADGKRRYNLVEQHYTQLIRLFGNVNRPDKAMEVLQIMREDIGASTSAYNGVLGGFAHNYDTTAATAMFEKMRDGADGAPPPDVHTFNHMILAFGRARQLQQCFVSQRLLQTMHSSVAYHMQLAGSCAFALCLMHRCSQMYFRMICDDQYRMEPNSMSYARLIEACGSNLRLEEAEAVFGEMKAQRVPPDDRTYHALIKAAGRRKDVERAWELFDEMLDEYLILPSIQTYTALISASSHAGDSSRAFEAYDHLLAEGLQPNLSLFNALIWVCGETKDMDGAFHVIKEMGKAGVAPDVRCYSRLLRACGVGAYRQGNDRVNVGAGGGGAESLAVDVGDQAGLAGELVAGVAEKEEDLAYASQLLATLERIASENLPRNRALYLALLRSAGRARQARLVFRVFEEMKREGIKPDQTVYTHLLNACRQCSRLNACEAVFTQMKEHTPPLVNPVCYNILMAAAAESNNAARSLELFDEMMAAAAAGNGRLEPDRVTYITAMNAAGLSLQPDRAFECFRALQASMADSVESIEERTWCLLIKACGESMDYDRALSVFKEAQESGTETTVLLYNAMMNAAGKVYDTVEMERLFQEMLGAGIRPNSISYNILMHVSGELKQLDQVKRRYAEMLELGVRPDAVTYSVLIGAAGKALELDLAFEFFEQLKEEADNNKGELSGEDDGANLSLSTVTFINLINACEASGRLDRAFEVFEEMKTSGFIPNVQTYTALLHACVEARREHEARNVLVEMVDKSLPVEVENLMALKIACEANAYDGCVELIDELLKTAISEIQLQASALGFDDVGL